MKRIVIIGASGTGKTTLAHRLAQKLDYPVTDFDDIYWRTGWTPTPPDEFARLAERITAADAWIIVDPYDSLHDMMWSRADTVIWIDHGFWLLAWRLIRRSFARIRNKDSICNGNVETWRRFFSGDGLLLWLTRYFLTKRPYYKKIFMDDHKPRIPSFIRLDSPVSVNGFIANYFSTPADQKEKFKKSLPSSATAAYLH